MFAVNSLNHRFPSAPAAIPDGTLNSVGIGNSVIAPPVVILAILLPPGATSVAHSAPSGPSVMAAGELAPGRLYSVIAPAVVIRPILPGKFSQNHSAPSGPGVMPEGVLRVVGIGNSTIVTPRAAGSRPAPSSATATAPR